MNNFEWHRCVGPGWKSLVDEFVEACNWAGGLIFDVKEKWGGLRIHFLSPEETYGRLEKLADDLEDRSFKICEDCGAPGTPKSNYGWIRTLCDKCRG